MTIRHFVDASGAYLGGFGDGAPPPAGASEVAAAPAHAAQVWIGGTWTWPLEYLRRQRLHDIDTRYEAALAAGLAYGGKLLQIREGDQQNIAAMGQEARWAIATGSVWPANFAWRMADNSFLVLPAATDMVALGEAAKAEIYRLRQVKWAHVDVVASAANAAALLSHDIDTGW